MGFNTVAVLYNDCSFADDVTLGNRIEQAIRQLNWPSQNKMACYFGKGAVISQAHADYTQIVAVGKNTGKPISEANDLDFFALDQLKECLERHGYKVTKRRRRSLAVASHGREGAPE